MTDFRDLASGIASDLAGDRLIVMQDMQEKLGHVHRAQRRRGSARGAASDLLKDKIQADNDEQCHAGQAGARRLPADLGRAGRPARGPIIRRTARGSEPGHRATRARPIALQYQPDPNFFSPEVWANAYRLALYEVPEGRRHGQGTDVARSAQMKDWHDFTKSMDLKQQNELREQASPAQAGARAQGGRPEGAD